MDLTNLIYVKGKEEYTHRLRLAVGSNSGPCLDQATGKRIPSTVSLSATKWGRDGLHDLLAASHSMSLGTISTPTSSIFDNLRG